MDVFSTFVDLLRQVGVVSKRSEGVQVCCSPTSIMSCLSHTCHDADPGKNAQKHPMQGTCRTKQLCTA